MKIKKTIIWSAINGTQHKLLTEEEQQIAGTMPLVSALFPGINYYSMTGFMVVMSKIVIPVLKKLFPEMTSQKEEEISEEEISIQPFLKSDGYEWADSLEWQKRFDELLAA